MSVHSNVLNFTVVSTTMLINTVANGKNGSNMTGIKQNKYKTNTKTKQIKVKIKFRVYIT